jgi:transglutaminase-like putative cysteine protease
VTQPGASTQPAVTTQPGATTQARQGLNPDLAATLSLTALSLAAIYSLGRLYATNAYVGPVMTMAVAMHAVGWACRRRGLRTATAAVISLAAIVLLVSWLVLGNTTQYGLPLSDTLHAARLALNQASNDFRSVVAPAPVTKGFLLVTVAAVGVMVALADWAAFRMRTTLEAAVPSFTLFVFCAALGSRHHRNAAIFLELAALLTFVIVHRATVEQGGTAWFAGRNDGALTSAIKAGAVIALVAVLLALNLAFRLPGARAKAVITWRAQDRTGTGTRNTISPLVDIRSRILNNTGVEDFTVKTNQPDYWRLTSLDTFSGVEWTSDSTYTSVKHRLGPAVTPSRSGITLEQDFTITNLAEPWLPAAWEPDRISGITGVSYDPQSASLIYKTDTTTGLSYHVSSVINSGQIQPATLKSANAGQIPASFQRYMQLPPIPARVTRLANQLVAGKATEYDKARAIQDYLRGPVFTYDDNFDAQGDGTNALSYFLFTSHRGYCQQFAGAFAVLARQAGLPTRVAVGWTPGIADASGLLHVYDNQAHAWPEIYFSGVGWVSFEPTKGRGNALTQTYTSAAPAQADTGLESPSAANSPTAVPPRLGSTTPKTPGPDRGVSGGGAAGTVKQPYAGWPQPLRVVARSIGGWLTALIVMALLVGGWVGIAAWLRLTRRRSWHEAATNQAAGVDPTDETVITRAEILLAWTEATALLGWWSASRYPDETYDEFARRAAHTLRAPLSLQPDSVVALEELASVAAKAEFSAAPLTPAEARTAQEDLATLRQVLVGSASARQRLRLVLDPRVTVSLRA